MLSDYDQQNAVCRYESKVAEFDSSPEGMKLRAKVQTHRSSRRRRQTEDLIENANETEKHPFDSELAKYEDEHGFTKSVDPIWHFWNCLYFSATLYTTIG